MLKIIGNQFKKPSGFLGKIVSNIMINGNLPEYRMLINNMKIQANDKLLEIGFGPGVGINLIASNNQFSEIYGIDFSELMYKRAFKRNQAFISKNKVKLFYGDFLNTEIEINNFDKIYCLNVVYFWDSLETPFRKIRKLLKENGEFLIFMAKKEDLDKILFTKDGIFNRYSIEYIENTLKATGFNNVEYFDEKGYYIKAK